jgi:metal-responsive CopG/Arc/MetJ family transcriptional regulator
MPTLAVGNTVYTHPVAKVMISIPGKLLERLDERAGELGETRSGFLQSLVERELDITEKHRRDEIGRLLELATGDYGGDAAKLIREDRDSR